MWIDDLPKGRVLSLARQGDSHTASLAVERAERLAPCSLTLWNGVEDHAFADLKSLPVGGSDQVELFGTHPIDVRIGNSYLMVNTYWHNAFIMMVDSTLTWRPVQFSLSDTFVQPAETPGWRVSRPATQADYARTDGIIEAAGWDHEHCVICNTHIDSDHPAAFVSSDDHWLCGACYDRYVAGHDLSFVL